ncbi:hypothetical protein BOTCAL_0234g00150 [Botryotinia calthae]|uniref:Uncharacterized protein n=1 Tax=Botryotinia calthae TaxID=38488 RepID=A0A4Y8CYA6_9HELO|nr:hypothetical protein BOTCAL_0234g00150 [Botryotinia calthae]
MPLKRKASSELSNNPHTTKARNRLNNRNEFEVQIEKAKARDQAAITYQLNKIRRSNEWIQASGLERAKIKERAKNEVTHKRKVKGVHASNVAQRLGYGDDGGQFAQVYDGNDNFEDCEEDDEVLQERMWRDDDEYNGERFIDLQGDKEEQKQELFVHGIEKHRNLEFRLWQKAWKREMRSFQKKCDNLNLRGIDYLISLGPYIDRKTSKYYEIIPPHRFFTSHELMLWRNLRVTLNAGCEEGEPDWVQLPGPNECTNLRSDFSIEENNSKEDFTSLLSTIGSNRASYDIILYKMIGEKGCKKALIRESFQQGAKASSGKCARLRIESSLQCIVISKSDYFEHRDDHHNGLEDLTDSKSSSENLKHWSVVMSYDSLNMIIGSVSLDHSPADLSAQLYALQISTRRKTPGGFQIGLVSWYCEFYDIVPIIRIDEDDEAPSIPANRC